MEKFWITAMADIATDEEVIIVAISWGLPRDAQFVRFEAR